MFTLAIAAGLVASAGTVNWSAWDDDATGSSDLALYIMMGDLATGATIDAIKDTDTAKTYVAGAAGSGALDHTDYFYAQGQTGALSEGQTSFYAVLFDGDSIDTSSNYQVFGGYSVYVPGNGAASLEFDLTGLTASGWSSISGSTPTPPTPGPSGIPEPTSGLLLLVGGAMLALRRKQK